MRWPSAAAWIFGGLTILCGLLFEGSAWAEARPLVQSGLNGSPNVPLPLLSCVDRTYMGGRLGGIGRGEPPDPQRVVPILAELLFALHNAPPNGRHAEVLAALGRFNIVFSGYYSDAQPQLRPVPTQTLYVGTQARAVQNQKPLIILPEILYGNAHSGIDLGVQRFISPSIGTGIAARLDVSPARYALSRSVDLNNSLIGSLEKVSELISQVSRVTDPDMKIALLKTGVPLLGDLKGRLDLLAADRSIRNLDAPRSLVLYQKRPQEAVFAATSHRSGAGTFSEEGLTVSVPLFPLNGGPGLTLTGLVEAVQLDQHHVGGLYLAGRHAATSLIFQDRTNYFKPNGQATLRPWHNKVGAEFEGSDALFPSQAYSVFVRVRDVRRSRAGTEVVIPEHYELTLYAGRDAFHENYLGLSIGTTL